MGSQTSRKYDSKHISPFSTISSINTGNHGTSPQMSLNRLAPTFLPHYQSSSNPPTSLCISITMSLPLAQLICGMPPPTIPSLAPSINQHVTAGTFLLPLLQPTNQSRLGAAAHQPTPRSSALLSSPLQHQANCLQARYKTIQQFNQHLKAEHLERQILQLIVRQLQNDIALLRYLLFSPVETISDKDIAVKNSATSPKANLNSNPNPTPTSSAFISRPWSTYTSSFFPNGRRGTTQNENKQFCKRRLPAPTQHAGSSLQLQCRTSHQGFANRKNCLSLKYQVTHPSLRVFTLKTFSYTIKLASLNPATQTLLFGKSPE